MNRPEIQLPPPHLINTDFDLRTLAESLQNETLIALDTESNSLYVYHEQVCLIQLSTRKADYLIDPIHIEDVSPLGEFFADPAVEIILHDAKYDIACLKRDFGFEFTGLFDTMYAARVLGTERFGLAAMLEQYFDLTLDKAYQRANWGKRPLPPEYLMYARMDTHFLPVLRDILYEELMAADALQEACEIFDEIARTEASIRGFDENGFWRISDARLLSRRQLACLRELYLMREDLARQLNVPPFKVLNDAQLMRLTRTRIYSMGDLYKARVIKSHEVEKFGKDILKALAYGRKSPLPPHQPPRHERVDRRVLDCHEQLKQWRKERAMARGVESDIIMPRETLWEIARYRPRSLRELQDIARLGPWRTQTYGQEILRIVGGE